MPVQSKALNGLDSLLSIVQMPAGVPVPTFAIGVAGATNAALSAAAILALADPALDRALKAQRAEIAAARDRLLVENFGPREHCVAGEAWIGVTAAIDRGDAVFCCK